MAKHPRPTRTPKPKYTAFLSIRVTEDEKAALIAAAERRGRSYNWLTREIILRWLAQERRRRSR